MTYSTCDVPAMVLRPPLGYSACSVNNNNFLVIVYIDNVLM